jgi:hypothetical protein
MFYKKKHSVQLTKDVVREILEKDPKERVEDDIDILVEFMQNLQVIDYNSFSNSSICKKNSGKSEK